MATGPEERPVTVIRGDLVFTSAESFGRGWRFLTERRVAGSRGRAVAMGPATARVGELRDRPTHSPAETPIAALPFDYRSFGGTRSGPRQGQASR